MDNTDEISDISLTEVVLCRMRNYIVSQAGRSFVYIDMCKEAEHRFRIVPGAAGDQYCYSRKTTTDVNRMHEQIRKHT